MGDRGNIVIEKDGGSFPHPVYFYTHWRGSELKETLQAALMRGKDRWDDPEYLSRIIFCEMVKRDPDGTTGFGISTAIGDGEHRLLCVNMEDKKVRERDSIDDIDAAVLNEWTFDELVALDT